MPEGSVKKTRLYASLEIDLLSISPMEALAAYTMNKKRKITSDQALKNKEAWAIISGDVPEEDDDFNTVQESDTAVALREADEHMAIDFGISEEEINALDEVANGTYVNEDHYKEAFNKYDADGSGSISPEELRHVIAELGEDLASHEVDKLIKEADTDGDGDINYQEFVELMKARKRLLAIASKLANRKNDKKEVKTNTKKVGLNIPILSLGNPSGEPLPPLRLDGTTNLEKRPSTTPHKKRKKWAQKRGEESDEQMREIQDMNLAPRPTPHVLKSGAEADIHELRRQLGYSEKAQERLSTLIEGDIKFIQNNYPITGIKAQIFCKKWGFDKLEKVFKKIENSMIIAALRRWQKFIAYEQAQEKAQRYLRFRGSRRLVSMMADWQRKKFMAVWNSWMEMVIRQKQDEAEAAAVQIQRFVVGWLEKVKYHHGRRERASVQIQRIGRGYIARKQYKVMVRIKLENDSATKIQNCWR